MRIHTYTRLELTDDPNVYITREDHSHDYEGPLALADRAAQAQAQTAVQNANQTASGYGAAAQPIGSTLSTQLTREATAPQGYSPEDLNAALVSGQQAAGGAASGITGQAGLQAMRTRNSAALPGVLDQAARQKMQTGSQNALNVQLQNAALKQKQQQAGLAGLQQLYGTDVGAQLKSMGLVPEDIGAELQAGKQGWLQNAEGVADTIAGLGTAGVGAFKALQ
jgi:hypothetical protein